MPPLRVDSTKVHLFLFGFVVVQALSCKLPKEAKKASTTQEACLAKGASACVEREPGGLSPEVCAATIGAAWDEKSQRCHLPASAQDCQKAGKEWLWAGDGCVASSAPPNFYQLCMNSEVAAEIKHTLTVLSRAYKGSAKVIDCGEVFLQLKKKTSLQLQSEALVDLTPLQFFSNLEKLDLWNNKIVDVGPLASLSNLKELKLGHNRITAIEALSELPNLQRLYLSENEISRVGALSKLESLRFLDISYNRISDVSSLDPARYVLGFFAEGNEAPSLNTHTKP